MLFRKRIITKVVSLVDESESSPNLSNLSSSNSSLDSPNNNEAEFFQALYSICSSKKEYDEDIVIEFLSIRPEKVHLQGKCFKISLKDICKILSTT